MWRWAKIGPRYVTFLVAEAQGKLVIVDLRDE